MATFISFGPSVPNPNSSQLAQTLAPAIPDAIHVSESAEEAVAALATGWGKLSMLSRKDDPSAGISEVWVNAAAVRFVREL